jgi:hypothetical protein
VIRSETKRGPSRIRTGDGGFAIRCPDSATLKPTNLLEQNDSAKVPTVVPSFSEFPPTSYLPPELVMIVNAWPGLSPIVKAGILAMINAVASGQEAE